MIYSYYSLPRSYKHTPTARFEDDSGRGRRLCGNGRGAGGSGRLELGAGGPLAGRHLSLSSSSYSSSSASSESLGDPEDRAAQAVTGGSTGAGAARSKEVGPQQTRATGGQRQGPQHRSRPVSLFVDVSKANTLPRAREAQCPSEPRSPGEYVSIEYRGERPEGGRLVLGSVATSGTPRALQRPVSCLAGFQPIPPTPSAPHDQPTASEYVNMELGPSPSPSPLSLTPQGFSPYATPPTPPAVAPKVRDEHRPDPVAQVEEEGSVNGHRRTGPSPPAELEPTTTFTDYTEMFFSSSSASQSSSTVARAPSPSRPDPAGPNLGLGLEFPQAKACGNPDQGAKVIRADPQGRRRHCSETFLASPPLPTTPSSSSSSSSLFPEHAQTAARRFGLETAFRVSGAASETPSQCTGAGSPATGGSQGSAGEQGLNYIDLDLANKEGSHSSLDGPVTGQPIPSRLYSSALNTGTRGTLVGSSGGNGGPSNINTYASIDFCRSEELRYHQNGGRDGTEC